MAGGRAPASAKPAAGRVAKPAAAKAAPTAVAPAGADAARADAARADAAANTAATQGAAARANAAKRGAARAGAATTTAATQGAAARADAAKRGAAKAAAVKPNAAKAAGAKAAGGGARPSGTGRASAGSARAGRAVAAASGGTSAATAEAPPIPPGTDWTPDELAEVRTDLAAQLGRLRAEYDQAIADLNALQQSANDGAGDDQADAGAKTFEREQELSIANNRLDLLTQMQRAIERVDAGTYGRCESCGNPIPKARLQAFPSATLCVTCKQREERR